MRRSSSDLIQTSRAEERRLRLLEIENEQRAEEAEALQMTEEQRQTLLRSFTSVKFEFSDLDGLCWTQTALSTRQPSLSRVRDLASPPNLSPHSFLVLTKANIASFSHGETIRAPIYETLATSSPIDFNNSSTDTVKCRHRDGSRARSPIKGLFPDQAKAPGGAEPEMEDAKPNSGCLIRGRIQFAVSSISSSENRATVSSQPAYISYGSDPSPIPPPGLAPIMRPDTVDFVNDETPLNNQIEVNEFDDDILATPTPCSQFQLPFLDKDATVSKDEIAGENHNEEDIFHYVSYSC